jgi:hypothetical protein
MARCSPADVAAQLGAIAPEFTEVLAQFRPTSLDLAMTLTDFAAPCPMRAPVIGESRVAEQ